MSLYDYALSFYGCLYQWGGNGAPNDWGFDCSGYMSKILARGGFTLQWRHNAQELFSLFKNCPPGLRANALAFFGESETNIDHIGFMLDSKLMISAAGGGPSCTKPSTSTGSIKIQPISWYGNKFIGAYSPDYSLK